MSVVKCLSVKYRKEKKEGVELIDLSPNAMAGYYLSNYPGDPIGAISIDIRDEVVPSTKGHITISVLEAALKDQSTENLLGAR